MYIKELSDEFKVAEAVASKPRKRDFLKVLFGNWEPEVRIIFRNTAAGTAKMLRETYLPGIKDQMNQPSTLFRNLAHSELSTGSAEIPIMKKSDEHTD